MPHQPNSLLCPVLLPGHSLLGDRLLARWSLMWWSTAVLTFLWHWSVSFQIYKSTSSHKMSGEAKLNIPCWSCVYRHHERSVEIATILGNASHKVTLLPKTVVQIYNPQVIFWNLTWVFIICWTRWRDWAWSNLTLRYFHDCVSFAFKIMPWDSGNISVGGGIRGENVLAM